MRTKFAALLALCAVVMLSSGAWGAAYYEEHDGSSEANAYVIDSVSDLVELRDRVNAGTEPEGAYYKMDFADKTINLTSYTGWIPIGCDDSNYADDNYPFRGHFDGNGHTIKVNIKREGIGYRASLFGAIATAEGYAVKNLNVEGSIEGCYAGGIATGLKESSNASIEQCTFTGTIKAVFENASGTIYTPRPAAAGGIVEFITSGAIRQCTVRNAEITALSHNSATLTMSSAGGIAATFRGGIIEDCTVTGTTLDAKSASSGTVSNTEIPAYAGGITATADIHNSDNVKGCKFDGSITSGYAAGGIAAYIANGVLENNEVLSGTTITGENFAGGIGGIMSAATARNNKVNSSSVVSNSYTAGGICGKLESGGIIEGCSVTAGSNITSNGEDSGGIVGVIGDATVRDNTSNAVISGTAPHKGGIIGHINGASPTVSNNHYTGASYGIGCDASGNPSDNPGCIHDTENQTPGTETPEQSNQDGTSSGDVSGDSGSSDDDSGCDSGFGLLGLIAGAAVILRRSR